MLLKKNLIIVVLANIVVLLSSTMNNFFIPTVLSVQEFSDYKTYFLYSSFIGFLHFGFVDGINVFFGGMDKQNVDKSLIRENHTFFVVFQVFITLCVFTIALISDNVFLYLISAAIIPINITSFFLFFYQAIGDFKLYALIAIIAPILNILMLLILIFFDVVNFELFIAINIFCYFISMIILEMRFFKERIRSEINFKYFLNNYQKIFKTSFKNNSKLFRSGIFIMLGTVLFNLFFDTGRWMAKIFTSTEKFAVYSISMSIIGMILIFVSAINKTFYPYMHKNNNSDVLLNLRKALYCMSTLVLPFFFILKYIILKFLNNYADSLSVAAILSTAIPGIFIIKSIYANLYKIEKKEYLFFKDTMIYLIIGLFLNLIFYYFFKTLNSLALASVITIYIWNFFPRTFKSVNTKIKLKDALYLLIILTLYFGIFIYNLNPSISFFSSLVIIFMVNIFFYQKTLFKILKFK